MVDMTVVVWARFVSHTAHLSLSPSPLAYRTITIAMAMDATVTAMATVGARSGTIACRHWYHANCSLPQSRGQMLKEAVLYWSRFPAKFIAT